MNSLWSRKIISCEIDVTFDIFTRFKIIEVLYTVHILTIKFNCCWLPRQTVADFRLSTTILNTILKLKIMEKSSKKMKENENTTVLGGTAYGSRRNSTKICTCLVNMFIKWWILYTNNCIRMAEKMIIREGEL